MQLCRKDTNIIGIKREVAKRMEKAKFKEKALSVILVALLVFSGIIPYSPLIAKAEEGVPFDQGAGFQQGLYDRNAAQPTVFNWTRQSRFNGPDNPQMWWKYNFPSGYNSHSPVIGSDGTIYSGGDKLLALSSEGKEKWNYSGLVGFTTDPVIGQDGTIYFGADKLYAISTNGEKKWDFDASLASTNASPAIAADGTIYYSSSDGYLYAVNSTGELKWTYFVGANAHATSPVVGRDGTIYFGVMNGGELCAIKPDGSLKWKFPVGGASAAPVIGSDGTIYFGSSDKNFYALNPDGTEKWNFTTGGSINSTAAIGSDGTIYFSSQDYNLYAVKPDGNELWENLIGYSSGSSPIIGADGTVYCLVYSHLWALDKNGQRKWNYYIDGDYGAPAIGAEGVIYIASPESLFAIGNKVRPEMINGFEAAAQSSTEVQLMWPADSNATSYAIYRSKSSNGVYTQIGITEELNYIDKDLSPLTTYWYQVSGVNSYGEGPRSYAESAQTLDVNTPTGLQVIVANAHQADLSWDSVSGATVYKVYRSQNPYGTYSLISTTTDSAFSDSQVATYNTYWYKVSAILQSGSESGFSPPESVYITRVSNITLLSVSLSPAEVTIGQVVTVKVDAQDDLNSLQSAEVTMAIDSAVVGNVTCTFDSLSNSLIGKYVVNKGDLLGNPSATLSVDSIEVYSSEQSNPKLFTSVQDFISPQVVVTDSDFMISLSKSDLSVQAVVTHPNGDPVSNAAVNFYYYYLDKEDAWYNLPQGFTNQDGVAQTELSSLTTEGTVCVIAEVGGVASQDTLQFNVESLVQSIELTPAQVSAGQSVDIKIKLGSNTSSSHAIYATLQFGNHGVGVWCSYDSATSTYVGGYTIRQYDYQESQNKIISISRINLEPFGSYGQMLYANEDFLSPSVTLLQRDLKITLSTDKELLTNQGGSTANITATVTDQDGHPIPNSVVNFNFFREDLDVGYGFPSAKTDQDGKTIVPLDGNYGYVGTIYVWAEVAGFKSQNELALRYENPVPTSIQISAEKNTFDADGIYQVPLRIEAYDQTGEPIRDQSVQLISSGSGQLNSNSTWLWASWDNNEIYNEPNIFYTVPTTPGSAQIVAKMGDLESEPLLLTFEEPQVAEIIWSQEEVSVSISDLSQAPLQARILDRNGVGLAGQVVSFNIQGPGALTTSLATSEEGRYGGQGIVNSGIIAPSEIGEAIITASVGGIESPPLPVHYVTAVPGSISWNTPDRSFKISADGKMKLSLSALVLDQTQIEWGSFGHLGEPVRFTLSGLGSLSQEIVGTNAEGIAEVTLTAPELPGSATLVASIGELTTEPITIEYVEVQPSELIIQIAESDEGQVPILDADGLGLVPVKVTLRDTLGNPIAGQYIQFSNSGNLLMDSYGGITDVNGQATVHMIAPPNPGSVTVTASYGEFITRRLIYFDTPRPRSISWGFEDYVLGDNGMTLTSEASLEADGLAVGKAYVRVYDGNQVPLSGVTVKFGLEGEGILETSEVVTDLSGKAEVKITAPEQLGSATIKVDVPGFESYRTPQPIEWTLHYVAPSPGEVLLSATKPVLLSDGQDMTELNVRVFDHHGVALSGQNVLLWQSGSGSLNSVQLVTDMEGRGSVKFTAPSSSGTAWIIAASENVKSEPLKVQFVEEGLPALKIITTVLPSTVQGTELKALLKVTGGTAPYTWSARGLPQGLALDPVTGLLQGVPSTFGIFPIGVSVSDALGANAYVQLLAVIYENSSDTFKYSAQPLVSVERNTADENTGIFIGISSIVDTEGKEILNPNIAGYKVEIDYDSENVHLLDAIDMAHLGHFTKNLSQVGKAIITDAGTPGSSSMNPLVFIPLKLTGSALNPTNITLRFLELSDKALNPIDPPEVINIPLQRGRVLNPVDGRGPRIVDAVAGLQYLARLREAGSEDGQVNLLNMASISLSETEQNKNIADIKDIIALLQYLAELRDDHFQ